MSWRRACTNVKSKTKPDSAVDDDAIGRSPEIDGPSSVVQRRRQQERIVFRLPDIEDVLGVHEQPRLPDAPLAEQSDQPIRTSSGSIRVVFERLPAGVVHLDAEPAPVAL